MSEQAAHAGLNSITITDHCEIHQYQEGGFAKSVLQSYIDTKEAQLAFADDIKVLCGIELGQPLHDVQTANEVNKLCNLSLIHI